MRAQLTVYFDDNKQEGCVIREATILEIVAALNLLKSIQANGEQLNTLDVALYAPDIIRTFKPCLDFFPDENINTNKLGASDLMEVVNGLIQVNSTAVGKLTDSLMKILPTLGLAMPSIVPTEPLKNSNAGLSS